MEEWHGASVAKRRMTLASSKNAEERNEGTGRELQDLQEKRSNGEEVDEDRLYCLELFARQMVGEDLTEDERLDLEDFEKEEEEGEEVGAAAISGVKPEAAYDGNEKDPAGRYYG